MNVLEITGFIFGIAGVWLTIKKSIWCFPVGLINVSITAYLVIQQKLYADFLQQTVYFILLIYGWFLWSTVNKQKEQEVRYSSVKYLTFIIFVFLLATPLMGFILKTYTAASFPYWDSAGTIICFIAQWMVAKKRMENWFLWMVANMLYIVIYLVKDLPLYSVLAAVYLVMAFVGLNEWKKMLKNQTNG